MPMRMEKVNQQLRKQLTEIIHQEVEDPALEFLSITKVETTKDLRESKVYFSLLNEANIDYAREVLKKMGAFIRLLLGKRVRLKVLPHLTFIADDSIKYSVDIYQKIEEIKRQDQERC